MRRSRQRCSDSQCFFSILPLAAALKLPEGDKGQCGTCLGWQGDDAVPSKTRRAAQHLGSTSIYTCTQKSPHRQGLKSSGCQRFMTSTVTPNRAETRPAAPNTFASHLLCTAQQIQALVSVLMCEAPLCWAPSPALQWVRRWAWLSPKAPSFLLPKEKAAIIPVGPSRLKAQSTFTPPSQAFR